MTKGKIPGWTSPVTPSGRTPRAWMAVMILGAYVPALVLCRPSLTN